MGQSRPFGAPPVNVWVTLDHGHWADTLLGSANNGSRSIDSISSSVRPGPHFRIAKKAPISGAASLTGVSSRLIGHNRPFGLKLCIENCAARVFQIDPEKEAASPRNDHRDSDPTYGNQWAISKTRNQITEPNSFIVVTSRPSPLNQANFFNCTVSAEQPVPAAGGGD